MSAFIVNTECMDRVVGHVLKNARFFGGVDTESKGAGSRIGKILYTLNTEAVNYRYSETDSVPAYRYRERPSTPIQTYKSICSFLYQCCEGDQFTSTVAFQELEEMSYSLASRIIADLPEWAEAAWG